MQGWAHEVAVHIVVTNKEAMLQVSCFDQGVWKVCDHVCIVVCRDEECQNQKYRYVHQVLESLFHQWTIKWKSWKNVQKCNSREEPLQGYHCEGFLRP